MVLTGSVEARGIRYILTVKAVDSANGNELGMAQETVTDKRDVLKGIQSVASKLRDILGDTTPESVRLTAGETVTTTSLEALKSYSIAQDLSSSGRKARGIHRTLPERDTARQGIRARVLRVWRRCSSTWGTGPRRRNCGSRPCR